MQDDKCPHPARNGQRCDTEHISWYCHRWKHIRAPFLQALKDKLDWVKERSQFRHKLLEEILGNNCFRQCGICPGSEEALTFTYKPEDNVPY